MRADWIVTPPAPAGFAAELAEFHPLTAQALFARGHTEPGSARAFLTGQTEAVDPFALRDMPCAVERVLDGVQRGEVIALYGDYDCDGVTSCALLKRTLDSLGARSRVYLPNRFEEGYGLNTAALDELKADGVGLVVTVDCGARAMREAVHAAAIGLDLIITDHHELEPGQIPPALAVVDPKRPDCPYPFKYLAGVGVAFRLAQCLLRQARERGMPRGTVTEASLLDLVAIGTVADVAELTGENRALVRAGLRQINLAPRPGVLALMQVAGVRAGGVNAGRVGFALGPRLNAAGRLESAQAAYELLACDDVSAAGEIASKLDGQNSARQSLTAAVASDAEQQALAAGVTPLLFAASTEYNAGVIGLAAARLMERYFKPAIVVSVAGGEARGSCRSIPGFHITRALDECGALLAKHGGHAAAAGFTIDSARLGELQRNLSAIAEREAPAGGWRRVLRADGELLLRDLDPRAFVELEQLEPHGIGNPKPVFVVRSARIAHVTRMGKAEAGQAPPHLKLRLSDGQRAIWEAVAWRMGDRAADLRAGQQIDVAVQFDVNEWNGERRLQLDVKDFHPTQEPGG
jgi:single-stranded-DNA-specific exonuclease